MVSFVSAPLSRQVCYGVRVPRAQRVLHDRRVSGDGRRGAPLHGGPRRLLVHRRVRLSVSKCLCYLFLFLFHGPLIRSCACRRCLSVTWKSVRWFTRRLWSSGCRSRYQGFFGRLKFLRRPFCVIGESVPRPHVRCRVYGEFGGKAAGTCWLPLSRTLALVVCACACSSCLPTNVHTRNAHRWHPKTFARPLTYLITPDRDSLRPLLTTPSTVAWLVARWHVLMDNIFE